MVIRLAYRILVRMLRAVLPEKVVNDLCYRLKRIRKPAAGLIKESRLRSIKPVSTGFGYDRGLPIDRYYIGCFLEQHRGDITGRVLEVGDDTYTRRFGGSQVTQIDILHISADNPNATIVADLADAPHIPDHTFDCLVITQTFQMIYEVRLAVRTCWRILKPGGVLLATFPGITTVDQNKWNHTWYWSFNTLSAVRIFGECFGDENVSVASYGNVLSATAFLQGLAAEELKRAELDFHDPAYQSLVTVRALKSEPIQ